MKGCVCLGKKMVPKSNIEAAVGYCKLDRCMQVMEVQGPHGMP
jgi:hypothetical protein